MVNDDSALISNKNTKSKYPYDWKNLLAYARGAAAAENGNELQNLVKNHEDRPNVLKYLKYTIQSAMCLIEEEIVFSNGDLTRAFRFALILSSNRFCVEKMMSNEYAIHTLLEWYLGGSYHEFSTSIIADRPKKCSILAAQVLSNIYTMDQTLLNTEVLVGMISTQGSLMNQNAIAAIVTALHNAIKVDLNSSSASKLALKVSQDKLLIGNLLRYVLPVHARVNENNDLSSVLHSAAKYDVCDANDAIEWITKVVWSLFQQGMSEIMYLAVSGGSQCVSTLEQVVLLYCLCGAFESESLSNMKFIHKEDFQSTLSFLALEAVRLTSLLIFVEDDKNEVKQSYVGEKLSICAITTSIHDVISFIILQVDRSLHDKGNNVRLQLCDHPAFIRSLVRIMDDIIHKYSRERSLRATRDLESIMSNSDKQLITSSIKLVANLCYRCKPIQDKLREMSVDSRDAQSVNHQNRNAIHVILSCTSLSFACFGLREWSIVAIRNILEDNHENKEIVEKLRAQEAINTPDLHQMGLSVNVDQHGNVNVNTRRK